MCLSNIFLNDHLKAREWHLNVYLIDLSEGIYFAALSVIIIIMLYCLMRKTDPLHLACTVCSPKPLDKITY